MEGGKTSLPEDIIRSILKRLPVKHLIRSQCVCKYWKNLIKTPSFIAEHIQYNTLQNPCLLFQGYGRSHPSGWCFLDHQMQVVHAQSEPLIGALSAVRIIDSINGLICFQSKNSSIFLWNPATREVRQVFEVVNTSEPRYLATGFGFSSIISDYKVVRVHVSSNHLKQVHIYSLNTGSWNEIESGNLDGVSLMSNGFSANGAIFWFGFKLSVGKQGGNDGHFLVSFDVATEVFTLIPLPSSIPMAFGNRLVGYEDKLAILCHTTLGDFEFSSIDLWVMEEGTCESGRWNWTKKYSTSPYPCLLRLGTIWRNEIVCHFVDIGANRDEVNNEEGKVVLFNIATKELKTFPIPKYGDGSGLFLNYVESLVSVGNNHIEGL